MATTRKTQTAPTLPEGIDAATLAAALAALQAQQTTEEPPTEAKPTTKHTAEGERYTGDGPVVRTPDMLRPLAVKVADGCVVKVIAGYGRKGEPMKAHLAGARVLFLMHGKSERSFRGSDWLAFADAIAAAKPRIAQAVEIVEKRALIGAYRPDEPEAPESADESIEYLS